MLYHLSLYAAAMFLFVQANNLIFSPSCPFCGKRKEHARDCPENK